MNDVRMVGKILDKLHPYDGSAYKVQTRRSGNKEVYDEIAVVLPSLFDITIGQIYQFYGTLGVRPQIRAKEKIDICVYVKNMHNISQDEELFNEVFINGTIMSIDKDPKIPNKMSLLLNADDDSYDKYKVVAWGKRLNYLKYKKVGDHLRISGELVKYVYRVNTETFFHTEIIFWFEEPK